MHFIAAAADPAHDHADDHGCSCGNPGAHVLSLNIQILPRYEAFFHHYQGSIDFNIVNIHPTVEMYFLISTGNRDDIE